MGRLEFLLVDEESADPAFAVLEDAVFELIPDSQTTKTKFPFRNEIKKKTQQRDSEDLTTKTRRLA